MISDIRLDSFVYIPSLNTVIGYNSNENETLYYPPEVQSSSKTLIFDTRFIEVSARIKVRLTSKLVSSCECN
jgi:hypothetical protein